MNIFIMYAYIHNKMGNKDKANKYLLLIEKMVVEGTTEGDPILHREHVYGAILRLAKKLNNQELVEKWSKYKQ